MRVIQYLILPSCVVFARDAFFFSSPLLTRTTRQATSCSRPPTTNPKALRSATRERVGEKGATENDSPSSSPPPPPAAAAFPELQNRGKVNEIDFCMAPSDVSLSRSYANAASISGAPPAGAGTGGAGGGDNANIFGDDGGDGDVDDGLIGAGGTAAAAATAASPGAISARGRMLSLTRALNNVSNRAVRRVLLARSWPSAEALNLSLRQTLATSSPSPTRKAADGGSESSSSSSPSASGGGAVEAAATTTAGPGADDADADEGGAKCPVPRPVLNIIMRRRGDGKDRNIYKADLPVAGGGGGDLPPPQPSSSSPRTKKRTDEQWISDQMGSFRQNYGAVPGYDMAEAYLECILCLATKGVESEKVSELCAAGVYDEPYRRIISVLKSVGAEFVDIPRTAGTTNRPMRKIAPKLVDKDICLSMLDTITIRKEKRDAAAAKEAEAEEKEDDDEDEDEDESKVAAEEVGLSTVLGDNEEESSDKYKQSDTASTDTAAIEDQHADEPQREARDLTETKVGVASEAAAPVESSRNKEQKGILRMLFGRKDEDDDRDGAGEASVVGAVDGSAEGTSPSVAKPEAPIAENATAKEDDSDGGDGDGGGGTTIKREDLGGVLLSAEEPSMTRQLNVLSNIVQRALLFGGDQELLVLYETLEADRPAFVRRWYPSAEAAGSFPAPDDERRPGVQYLNCLLQLLKGCFTQGVVTDLDPPFPLSRSYSNAYERLTATLVELGSGYVKPVGGRAPLPKSAKEELGRFAQWEVKFRQGGSPKEIDAYPDDLVGDWSVKDEVQGKTIGVTNVTFAPGGLVEVAPPMQGLRWRLDPGPTHLDTCTFQVLGDDGTILQYRGFVDRGARLEARFSRRPIKIRGAATFQMRDGESAYMGDDYRKDMLPINYKTGTTRFEMTKAAEDRKTPAAKS